MANQLDPNKYSLMCRCQLADAAAIRDLAQASGKTMSAYVASLIHSAVGNVTLTPKTEKWMLKRFLANKRTRARADRAAKASRLQEKKSGQ